MVPEHGNQDVPLVANIPVAKIVEVLIVVPQVGHVLEIGVVNMILIVKVAIGVMMDPEELDNIKFPEKS